MGYAINARHYLLNTDGQSSAVDNLSINQKRSFDYESNYPDTQIRLPPF